MPKKEDLLQKLCWKPVPKNFTKSELDILMKKCGCEKYSGGRGSSIAYLHNRNKKNLAIWWTTSRKRIVYLSNKDDNSIFERYWWIVERGVYMNSMLEYKGYHAIITYDADDELFVGEVLMYEFHLNYTRKYQYWQHSRK